jgi:serine/threonine protein kinase
VPEARPVSDSLRCSRCGSPQVAGAGPLDLCPACLLAMALSREDEPCPYRVMAPMGEDARGVTYLAQALAGERGYVALKVCGPREDTDTVLSRYRHWKPALARVQHPSVGRLLDIGLTAEGTLYVASDYVAGWPLTTLGSRGSVGMPERLELARQLTAAVDAVHAAGVLHLKLDPSRVKISTANGPHATILGLGSSIIVDGATGQRDVDRLALARIIRELGIEP